MLRLSGGILLFRRTSGKIEVFLVHPGGPYWAKKDDGVWSVPKGMAHEGEEVLDAARREFTEETGNPVPNGLVVPLGHVYYGNKKVFIWAVEANLDETLLKSNLIPLEWPPKSGQMIEVPECDKAGWFDAQAAKTKLVKGQVPFIERLGERV